MTAPKEATVLVTDQIYRTYKFLSAMARGIPIVSEQWLKMWKGSIIPNPQKFLLLDKQNEKRYHFQLKESLNVAKLNNIFKDHTIICSPNTIPPPDEMKIIVESCEAKYFDDPKYVDKKRNSKQIVVADSKDKKFIESVKSRYYSHGR